MLNPSVAGETDDDATVTRCIARAAKGGYGALEVVNLFALVSTDPQALYAPGIDPECDGMPRVLSTLMQRDRLEHRVFVGRLDVEDCGAIPTHWWIELPDGRICDLRARMWLGGSAIAPHGLFFAGGGQRHSAREQLAPSSICLPHVVFELLAGQALDAFPSVAESEVLAHA
jgi:hypothetical protein